MCMTGLIVVGVAVKDRSIDGEDFGYLLALFVALYIIRGIVVLFAYPVLRSVSSVRPYGKRLFKLSPGLTVNRPPLTPLARQGKIVPPAP